MQPVRSAFVASMPQRGDTIAAPGTARGNGRRALIRPEGARQRGPRYNGLTWRIRKRADMETPPAGEPTQERVMYYSASWQLLEERITDDLLVEAPAEPEVNRHMQYIWGNRYIDDIALRRQNHNFGNDSPDVTYEDTRYHLTDTLFSTVVIINHAGAVSERVSYSPYGKARHHRTADLTGDGAVNSADQLHLFNAWGDGFFADYNRDGSVDSADLLFLTTNWGAAESPGRLSVTDNTIGFAGYVFNDKATSRL